MSVQEIIQSINNTVDQILEISKGVEDSALHWKPSQVAWSIMEVLCHVEEATPYWLNEIQQVVAAPGSEWGRRLQHEGRLAAVAGAGSRSLKEVLQGIEASKQKVQEILASVTEAQLRVESPSRNPRFGTKPVKFIVNHLLVEHLITHLKQINRNLQQYKEANQTV